MKHKIKPETLPEYEENAQRAGRVGLEMLRGIFENTYRMGYEAGAKAPAALSAPVSLGDGMGVRNIWFAHLQRANNWQDTDAIRDIFDVSFDAGIRAATDVRDDRLKNQAVTISNQESLIQTLKADVAKWRKAADEHELRAEIEELRIRDRAHAEIARDTRSRLEWLDTAAVLRKVRERLLGRSTEIPFGDGSKRRFVALQAVFDTIDELSELEANITDPQKPTKPAIPLCVCKRTPDRHIQTVKGDGWLDCDGFVRLYR